MAAGVHLAAAAAAVRHLHLAPASANPVGFACAFVVSFVGQRRFTFRSQTPIGRSMGRWLATSAAGFALNQGLFLGGLTLWPTLPYLALLAMATLMVATVTYCAGQWWAFAHTLPHDDAP